jgi:hypothetical protein
MTMTEKLKRIRAKCIDLLALAESRTQGVWSDDGTGCLWVAWDRERCMSDPNGYEGEHISLGRFEQGDFEFIAACAGASESGWKSTIAAIDELVKYGFEKGPMAKALINAWPDELL